MARPVECRIVDMPDGRFAVMSVLASDKVFRRVGRWLSRDAEPRVEAGAHPKTGRGTPSPMASAMLDRRSL